MFLKIDKKLNKAYLT